MGVGVGVVAGDSVNLSQPPTAITTARMRPIQAGQCRISLCVMNSMTVNSVNRPLALEISSGWRTSGMLPARAGAQSDRAALVACLLA